MDGRGVALVALAVLAVSMYMAQNYKYSLEVLTKELKGKVVVVCGASSGIGEQIAYKYASAGSHVIISARSVDRLAKVKSKCRSLGAASVHVIAQDFSKLDQIENFRSKVLKLHSVIDILVLNHAAIPLGPWSSMPSQQHISFTSRAFNINVLSHIELTRVFLEDLERSAGQIQVTGSVSGSCPFYQAGLYTATKFALNGFFYSFQQELLAKKSPVTVTVITLGLVVTHEMDAIISSESHSDHIPSLFKGDVEECAHIIVSSAINRPRTVDYPIFMAKTGRLAANFLPFYQDIMTMIFESVLNYEDSVKAYERIREFSGKIGYQVGNTGTASGSG